ncbi:PIN-like domain-containing protein [Amycolatopsis sp. NPDC021455]|uniref:PIN-like domain-containing protein n=1 Tax=Amycolatopsis sp. NPDC021455 TaxID=3154901 RepID=UPI0033C96623
MAQGDVGGLTDGFEGYLTPADDDYREVLRNGLVVVDANVILNLYRYESGTREDLFGVLEKFGERLWVPHQVALEFWNNREAALGDLKKVTGETVEALGELGRQAPKLVQAWASRISLPDDKEKLITDSIADGFRSAVESIEEYGRIAGENGHWDTNEDQVLAKLRPLLAGKVGRKFAPDEVDAARREAMRRIENREPPGFKDKDKPDPCGDYFVWRQTLEEAKRRKVDVLFVTDDSRRDDWYRRPGGQTRGPRLELIDEMRAFCGVRLFMMRTESLLFHAGRVLDVTVRESSVEDVVRVEERPVSLDESPADEPLVDEHQSLIEAAKRSDERLRRMESEFAAVRRLGNHYFNFLKSLGFTVERSYLPNPHDYVLIRGEQRFYFYLGLSVSPNSVSSFSVPLGRLLGNGPEEGRKEFGDVVFLLSSAPSDAVEDLADRYGFSLVWPEMDGEWRGNSRAVEWGLAT